MNQKDRKQLASKQASRQRDDTTRTLLSLQIVDSNPTKQPFLPPYSRFDFVGWQFLAPNKSLNPIML